MAKLSLYGLGGAGSNLVSHFVKYKSKESAGFAEIVPYFVDTSKSNKLNPSIPEECIYYVDGLDGSGKKRDSNYEILAEKSKEILHHFKPSDINVLVHSASGGSGSVLGPILASELLHRGEMTIVVIVGSTGSKIETENTVKTLKSYEVISHKRQTPVIAFYRENSVDKPRGHVDSELQTAIVLLASIFSGANRELDMSDLRNFLNYTKVTSYSAKLSLLDFFSKEVSLSKGQSLVSLVSLVDDKTSPEVSIPTEYQAVGFLPDASRELVNIELPIHASVISGYFNGVVQKLDERLEFFKEARNVVVEKSIVSDHHSSTDEGLVL